MQGDQQNQVFDWKHPKLAQCNNVSSGDKAKLIVHNLIHLSLVPLIGGGQSRQAEVSALTERTLASLVLPPECTCSLLKSAVTDVLTVSRAMQQLANNHADDGFVALDGLERAKSGAKMLVKQAIAQSGFWKNREKALRDSHTAVLALTPELKEALKILTADEVLVDQVKKIARDMPKWDNALPEGARVGGFWTWCCFLFDTSKQSEGEGGGLETKDTKEHMPTYQEDRKEETIVNRASNPQSLGAAEFYRHRLSNTHPTFCASRA